MRVSNPSQVCQSERATQRDSTLRRETERTSNRRPISFSSNVLRWPHVMPKLSRSRASVSTNSSRDNAYLRSRFWKMEGKKYDMTDEEWVHEPEGSVRFRCYHRKIIGQKMEEADNP